MVRPAAVVSVLRILLISFHFPPDAPLAATRAPKFAKYLLDAGHDVRVICAREPQSTVTHPLEISEDRIIRTDWRDLATIPSDMLGRLKPGKTAPAGNDNGETLPTAPAPAPSRKRLRSHLGEFYQSAICRPDRRAGWRKPAIEAARKLFETWLPELIYATCPPHSVAPIAKEIADLHDIPFVTEFRDRWALDAYSNHPAWRQRMDRKQEAAVLRDAAGIVTVSPLWAKSYKERYGANRIAVAMNGYDPSDYPLDYTTKPAYGKDEIELLYAGALYPGRRDPRTVFEAIALLGKDSKRVRVTMLGKDLGPAITMAEETGIGEQLTLLPPEPHAQIIQRQYAADALLMLQWNDERDAGTIPGKLFECIGARRPIIATGWTRGVAGDMILKRNLGVIANEPRLIANKLSALLSEKRAHGMIPPLPAKIRHGMSRPEQFATLDAFLERAAATNRIQVAAE